MAWISRGSDSPQVHHSASLMAFGHGEEAECPERGVQPTSRGASRLGSKSSTKNTGMFYFYLFRCTDNTLYAGSTNYPPQREFRHNTGKGAQ